jgi:hypothetical protein
MRLFTFSFFLAGILLLLSACETIHVQNRDDRRMIDASIANEKPENYYVGRRFYKVDYHMWGWVKKPGERWKQAQLVMLNEQKTLAPCRAERQIGSDNDYEYFLYGFYSGDKVYEPASDHFYPEFVLTKAVLVDKAAPLIYPDSRWKDPNIRFLSGPEY